MDMFEKQFEEQKKKEAPLAARMRPTTLKEFVGQEHIVGEGRVLQKSHRIRTIAFDDSLGAAGQR